MKNDKTYYQILGVDPHASNDVINRSARRLSEKYHPDRVAHQNNGLVRQYEQKMKEINEAQQVLCDPVARAKYNRKLRREVRITAPPVSSQAKSVDVIEMEIIEDDEELEIECPSCNEKFNVTRHSARDYVQCPMCGKKGSLDDGSRDGGDPVDEMLQCPRCTKKMKLPHDLVPNETIIECPYCGAQGTVG